LPLRHTDDDYRLTATLLAESGRQAARQLHLRGFFVLLGPLANRMMAGQLVSDLGIKR
jgi:hypothetical protein